MSLTKDLFVFSPLNIAGVGISAAILKWLSAVVGPEAWGTVIGNLKFAGILLLAGFVAIEWVLIWGKLLKLDDDEERRDKFFACGYWGIFCVFLVIVALGRMILMLVGVLDTGGTPPDYIAWLFESIDELIEFGG